MLRLIPILLLIPVIAVWADDDDYSDFEYEWKIDKDGNFEYSFNFGKDNSQSRDNFISKDQAYKECFTDGQIHASMSKPYNDMYPMLLFESKKMIKQCSEGYKDGYFN